MRNKITLLLPLIVLIAGCSPILKCIYGIRNPRPETNQTISEYVVKKGFPVTHLAVFNDSSSYIKMVHDPVFRKEIFGTMIFDSELNLMQKDSSLCEWSGCPRVAQLNPDSAYPVVTGFNSRELFSSITMIHDTVKPHLLKPGQYDFVVVNKWAMFIGKMNERMFPVDSCALARSDLKILCIDLNLDVQQEWKMSRKQIRDL